MRLILLVCLFFGGCFGDNLRACKDACPLGMKYLDDKKCACNTVDELCSKGEIK